jgi:hypothetical protein
MCNQHGDPNLGICDPVTGACACDGSTYGTACQNCRYGFVGNALNGGRCVAGCNFGSRFSSNPTWSNRMTLNATSGFIGLIRTGTNFPVFDNSTCIWVITAPANSTITLSFERYVCDVFFATFHRF